MNGSKLSKLVRTEPIRVEDGPAKTKQTKNEKVAHTREKGAL